MGSGPFDTPSEAVQWVRSGPFDTPLCRGHDELEKKSLWTSGNPTTSSAIDGLEPSVRQMASKGAAGNGVMESSLGVSLAPAKTVTYDDPHQAAGTVLTYEQKKLELKELLELGGGVVSGIRTCPIPVLLSGCDGENCRVVQWTVVNS